METAGHEDDRLPALSSYKPAARLACATDVVKSSVRIPTQGPASRIWQKISTFYRISWWITGPQMAQAAHTVMSYDFMTLGQHHIVSLVTK